MTGGTLSGGVVIALAAALWLAYLVPTWLRRRDYLNAERNAVRLQQTLRILAETAEMPEEVRVEATARDVARQQKLLKKAQARADAAARAHAASEARAAARLAAVPEPLMTESAEQDHHDVQPTIGAIDVALAADASTFPAKRDSQHHRPTRDERERTFAHAVRRTRLATTGVVIASLIGLGFGVFSAVTAGSWWLFAASAVLLVCAVAVLRRLGQQVAAHRAARRTRVVTVRKNPELYDHALHVEPVPEREQLEDAGWQPQPLPKPMYQSPGSRAATAMASLDAAVALRRASAQAELEGRAARIAAAQIPSLPTVNARPEEQAAANGRDAVADPSSAEQHMPSAPPSRYARMGVVDDLSDERIDLDEALRRRRAVG